MGGKSRALKAADVALWVLAAGTLALVVRERLVPWIKEAAIVDPGDVATRRLSLTDASTGDPVTLEPGAATLLLVFRSTCSACERAAPAWRALAGSGDWTVLGVGLEPRAEAAAYVRSRLAGTRLVVPENSADFTRNFRIQVVPTTLLIDREGRLVLRRAGPLERSDLEEILRLESASSASLKGERKTE